MERRLAILFESNFHYDGLIDRARIVQFLSCSQFKYLRPSGGTHVLKDTIWDAWHFDFKPLGAISYFLVPQIYAACLSDCVNNLTHWRRLLSHLRTVGAKLANSSTSQNPSCNTAKLVTAGDSDCVVMMVSGMMLVSLVEHMMDFTIPIILIYFNDYR